MAFGRRVAALAQQSRQTEVNFRRVRRIEGKQVLIRLNGGTGFAQFLAGARQVAIRLRQQRVDGQKTFGVLRDGGPVLCGLTQFHEAKEHVRCFRVERGELRQGLAFGVGLLQLALRGRQQRVSVVGPRVGRV